MARRMRSGGSVSFSSGVVSFGGGSVRFNEIEEYLCSPDVYEDQNAEVEEALEATMPDEHVIPAGGSDKKEASDTDSLAQDRCSIGSNDSSRDQSKIGAFIDKAKIRGKKLVSKKEKTKTPEQSDEASQCVLVTPVTSVSSISSDFTRGTEDAADETIRHNEVPSAVNDDPLMVYSLARKCRTMPFFQYRMMLLGALIAITITFPGFLTGLMWGLYVSFIGFLYLFVSDPKPKEKKTTAALSCDDSSLISNGIDVGVEASSAEDDGTALGLGDGVIYRGWMNELKTNYSPATYHVNSAQSVLVRLEGTTLRISRPAKAVLKHAFHEDPTLKHSQPTMVAQTIYDLEGAEVSLRPKRLACRRWWSRKYPIHIRFAHKNSALAEVDLSRTSMTRSTSLHPVASAPDGLPVISDIPRLSPEQSGYSAESETSEDEESTTSTQPPNRVGRSISAGELSEYQLKSNGVSAKKRGRSIYLFVRAAREKERWFHLIREACAKSRIVPGTNSSTAAVNRTLVRRASEVMSTAEDFVNDAEPKKGCSFDIALEYLIYRRNHLQYAKQMMLLMGGGVPSPERGSTISIDLGTMKWKAGVPEENSDLIESINALGSRIFFDFCRDGFWANAVKQKIQSKLTTIHLPYFIDTLSLSELDLGVTAPRIMGVYAPKMDEWGLWVDFEIRYQGGIKLMLQTSVNLIKLQSGVQQVETQRKVSKMTDSVRVAHYSDEELPESPESSPDEDFGSKNHSDGTTKERTGKKLLSIVERAAQSSLFQKAAKLPRVAKLMEEVSSTPLILSVEVEMVEGTMTINIPPPPSDRLWLFLGQMGAERECVHDAVGQRFRGGCLSSGTPLLWSQGIRAVQVFIERMNQLYFSDVTPKWVTFGGSYPGSLSAFFREKYPQSTIGAVSTSGAVHVMVDYYGYAVNTEANYGRTKPGCAEAIRKGFDQIIHTAYDGTDGRERLKNELNLCESFDETILSKSLQYFFSNIYGVFQEINQYTGDNANNATASGLGLQAVCSIMTNQQLGTELQRIGAVWDLYDSWYGGPDCNTNNYTAYIEEYSGTEYSDQFGTIVTRGWTWQTCTQLGYFATTDAGNNGMFGSIVPVDFYVNMCLEMFGPELTLDNTFKQVAETKRNYGAPDNYKGTNVVFTNGQLDPWISLGILKSNPANNVDAFVIEGSAHCSEMYPARESDSKALKDARMRIRNNLDKWIKENKIVKNNYACHLRLFGSAIPIIFYWLSL